MSASLRVLVAGARGRLGSLAVAALAETSDLVLAGTLGRGDDPRAAIAAGRADVFLDLSLAGASRVLAPLAARAGIAPVVGVSGLTEDDRQALARACAEGHTPGLLVPNFSLGAVLQMELAERLAGFLTCTRLHERHHLGKRDAPSGTALETAARLTARGASPPPITSERLADVLAEQSLVFAGEHETLELRHVVSDRRAYLPGMLLALRRVNALPGFAIGLSAVLDLPQQPR